MVVTMLPAAWAVEVASGWSLATDLEGRAFQLISEARDGASATAVCAVQKYNGTNPMLGGCNVTLGEDGIYAAAEKNDPAGHAPETFVSTWYFESSGEAGKYYIRSDTGNYMHWTGEVAWGVYLSDTRPGLPITVYTDGSKYILMQMTSDNSERALNPSGGAGRFWYGAYGSIFSDPGNRFILNEMTSGYTLADTDALDGKAYQIYQGSGTPLLGMGLSKEGTPVTPTVETYTDYDDLTGVKSSGGKMLHWFFEKGETKGEVWLRTFEGVYLTMDSGSLTATGTRPATPFVLYHSSDGYLLTQRNADGEITALHRNGSGFVVESGNIFLNTAGSALSLAYGYVPADNLRGGYQIYFSGEKYTGGTHNMALTNTQGSQGTRQVLNGQSVTEENGVLTPAPTTFYLTPVQGTVNQYYLRDPAGKYVSWKGTSELTLADTPAVCYVYKNQSNRYIFFQTADNNRAQATTLNLSGGSGNGYDILPGTQFGGYRGDLRNHFADLANQFLLVDQTNGYLPAEGLSPTSTELTNKGYYIIRDSIAVTGELGKAWGNESDAMTLLGKSGVPTNQAEIVEWAVTNKVTFWTFEPAGGYGEYYVNDGRGQYMCLGQGNDWNIHLKAPGSGKTATMVYEKDGKYILAQGARALNHYGGDAGERIYFGQFGGNIFTGSNFDFRLVEVNPAQELKNHLATDMAYKTVTLVCPANQQIAYATAMQDVRVDSNGNFSENGSYLQAMQASLDENVFTGNGTTRWTLIPTGNEGEYFFRSDEGKYLNIASKFEEMNVLRNRIKLYTNGVQYVLLSGSYVLRLSNTGPKFQQNNSSSEFFTYQRQRMVMVDVTETTGLQPVTWLDGAQRAIVSLGTEGYKDVALTSQATGNALLGKALENDLGLQLGEYWTDDPEVEEWTFTSVEGGEGNQYYIKNAAGMYLNIDSGSKASVSVKPQILTVRTRMNTGSGQKAGRADSYIYIISPTSWDDKNYTDCALNRIGAGASTTIGGWADDGAATNNGSVFALAYTFDVNTVETSSLNATVKLFNYNQATNTDTDIGQAGFQFFSSAEQVPSVDGTVEKTKDMLDKPFISAALSADGYPVLIKDDQEYSMNELFGDDSLWKVAEMGNGGMLFTKDEKGYYTYDSSKNAAWYDAAANRFRVYDCVVLPSYSGNWGGNFLPFNPVNGNTVRYLDRLRNAAGIYNYHLLGDGNTMQGAVDLWFGMSIQFDFYIPEGGTLKNEDIVFEFTGDDDVMVYIDDFLVLDISGVHGSLSGSINFATGEVKYANSRGNNVTVTTSLDEIFGRDDYMDFMPEHTMRIFYMERGGNISNAKFRFNLPTPNIVEVEKKIEKADGVALTEDEKKALDELDFTFRIKDTAKTEYLTGYYYLHEEDGTVSTQYTTDGVFSLKNGQRAQFRVRTTAAAYVVEELTDRMTDVWTTPAYTANANDAETSGSAAAAENAYTVNVAVPNATSSGDNVSVILTNRITSMEVMAPESVVIDYGLPVNVDIMSNDYAVDKKLEDGYRITGLDTSGVHYGTIKVVDQDGKEVTNYATVAGHYNLVYTPTKYVENVERVTYQYEGFSGKGVLTIIPATTMYYEDDFAVGENLLYAGAANSRADFSQEGGHGVVFQRTDPVGSTNTYGSDPAYLTSGDSLGVSHHANTTTYSAFFQYTFKGTGTAFYGRISNTTGYIRVGVYDADGKSVLSQITADNPNGSAYRFIDTKYAVEGATVYNTPIYSITDLPYGEYTVKVTVAKPSLWYGDQPDFYLDGIRVYNPVDLRNNTTASQAYDKDLESYATFVCLRDKLLSEQAAITQYKMDDAVYSAGNAQVEGALWACTMTETKDMDSVHAYVTKALEQGVYQVKAYYLVEDGVAAAPKTARLYYTTADGQYDIWGSVEDTKLDDGRNVRVFTFTPASEVPVTELMLRAYTGANSGEQTFALLKVEAFSVDWADTGLGTANVLFTDSKAEITNIGEYKNIGPKREIYLSSGQTVAFALKDWTASKAARLFLGMKALGNGTATLTINGNSMTLTNSTDSYFDVTAYVQELDKTGHGKVVIAVTEGSISLTGLKVTCCEDFSLLSPNKIVTAFGNGTRSMMTVHSLLAREMGAEVPHAAETPEEELPASGDLAIDRASLSLSSDISMNFYVNDSVLEGWDEAYMVFTKEKYDAEGNVIGCVEETVTVFDARNDSHVYSFHGIAAMEMSSKVTATLYASKDGEVFSGETVEYSVVDYATHQLAAAEGDFRTLLVDLLNYGAEAQKYWSYHTSSLANQGLEPVEAAQAPEMANDLALVRNEGADVHFVSATLTLREKVAMNFYLKGVTDAVDLYAVITVGNETYTIDGAAFVEKNGGYKVIFDGLNPAQMRTACTVEIFSKTTNQRVSDTLTYSIASYAFDKAGDARLSALVTAMMKYGDSTAAFFSE